MISLYLVSAAISLMATFAHGLPFGPILPKITIREESIPYFPRPTGPSVGIRRDTSSATTGMEQIFTTGAGTHGKRERTQRLDVGASIRSDEHAFRNARFIPYRPADTLRVHNLASPTTSTSEEDPSIIYLSTGIISSSSSPLPTGIRTLPPTTAISIAGAPAPLPAAASTTPAAASISVSSTSTSTSTGCPFASTGASQSEQPLPVIVTVIPAASSTNTVTSTQ
ncbi:hypothetical protein A1O1_07878 [Capronia coronata CBS 617.96]|uniref:Uncharacterized protein n=1 Tax=Capronia coronata CBS 617.96 TaxID=1182541 RepID=W9XNK8_9EURO|nr:uncharacterized protein A1O1_07878 [Capronia coronata CBS 617.96]EXJ81813.1 hypothetical protein A1O1_07878 [Capronia coronata CBS 617.96]